MLPTAKEIAKGLDFCFLPIIDIWLDLPDLLVFDSKLSNQDKTKYFCVCFFSAMGPTYVEHVGFVNNVLCWANSLSASLIVPSNGLLLNKDSTMQLL